MMVRTQVQLTEEQAAKVRALAEAEGASVAEIIRRSIDQYIHHQLPSDWLAQRQRTLELVGKYASDASDVSVEHDRYLAEIYAEVADEE